MVVVVVITPPLPRDGGTARTAIQVHAVHLIKFRLGANCGRHFKLLEFHLNFLITLSSKTVSSSSLY